LSDSVHTKYGKGRSDNAIAKKSTPQNTKHNTQQWRQRNNCQLKLNSRYEEREKSWQLRIEVEKFEQIDIIIKNLSNKYYCTF
jgi:hypothetical protein